MKLSLWLLLLVAAAGTGIYLRSQTPAPTPVSMPAAESYLIVVGAQDSKPTVWNGCVTVTGSDVLGMSVWRQGPKDSVTIGKATPICATGNTFQLSTVDHAGVSTKSLAENGVIVTVAAQTTDIVFDVAITNRAGQPNCTTYPNNCFAFHSTKMEFGNAQQPQRFVNKSVYVTRTPTPLQLTGGFSDEDYPAAARAGDDVWVSYIRFTHNMPAQQQLLKLPNPPPAWVTANNGKPDFSLLERAAGGDQVMALHYSIAGRTWTGPFPVTTSVNDTFVMRTATAVDGQNRAWVFYCVERAGNFDLYARRIAPGGTLSAEVRLTTDAGPDLNPVATTDNFGRVWVAWQGYRGGNLEILARAQAPGPQSDAFSPEMVVSKSPASDWDPAIAAAATGDEVAISWDTYDKGDYDVYLRRANIGVQLGNPAPGIVFKEQPKPIAASLGFEARSSIAYDRQNRLWIAYETADRKWGKDFGLLDTSGVNLYQNHNVAVRCLEGADLKAIQNDNLASVLPGPAPSELFSIAPPAASGSLPDPALAAQRLADAQLTSETNYPKLPNNSIPRLAVDSDGTVYLALRTRGGVALSSDQTTGQSVGSIWIEQLLYFNGVQWFGPGVIAQSDSLLDNRPALLALDSGHLLIAQATDHRLSPPKGSILRADTVNSDIYAAELTIQNTAKTPPRLVLSPAPVDAQSAEEKAEAAQVSLVASTTLAVAGQNYQIKRGDFHRHSEISFDGGGDGSVNDAYRYMIDAAPLDWGGCCDHDNGGAREYSWWTLQKYTEAYLMAGRYTPLFNYERSLAYPDGHRNAIFARRGVRPLPRLSTAGTVSPSPDTLFFYDYLKHFSGLDAAHSVGTDQGTDWNANDPTVETTVEIYQGDRQSYEMPDSPRANAQCDSIDTYKDLGMVSQALSKKGYLLGFESSSDHRSTHISYSNVWTTDASRPGILDAIGKRRVYAATDLILADVRMGDHFMGEAFNMSGAPTLTINLKGTAPWQEVDVIKQGAIVYTCTTSGTPACISPGATTVSFTWQDKAAIKPGETNYYYVRGLQQGPMLTTFKCEANTRTAGGVVWTSPMWVTIK